ncbi:bacteriocin [Lacticaseibacillus paracasei]|nr:bacteriocin [Lacticaseibacillus paracasei]WQG48509.1 bacteriocin [Lacticaseibacillus casei]MCH4041371.1 bacteriocin [Lacticaseibacillus paracasei]MCI1338333.1 bacteriocin [Lacticaseibacillus paracasei]MCI1355881.1 bacteriocin [Lacticaseibacillus paracasei]MCI1376750.1 bacteriocin [Lacticaseibacillus paracasei]
MHAEDHVLTDKELSAIIGGGFWEGIGRWIDQHWH